jgi:predicted acyl esterase
MDNTSSKYQNWEVVDPERWVPDGYVCVRIDSRGAGRSPGYLDPFSPRETKDFYNCIQWAAEQDWSNGKIGLNGISYYAINQWQVAELQPPNLTAMCIWEGAHDLYREWAYHGGMFCTYGGNWYKGRCIPRQHGLGVNGYKARINGDYVSGPPTLSNEELGFNRTNMNSDMFQNKLVTDQYWQERIPDFSKIHVPVLSAANWGGQSLHSRGNFEGFGKIASTEKWLEVHGLEHWTEFYTDYGVDMQKRFFGHYLKGEENNWEKEPRVTLQVRYPGDKFVERKENEWPLARTNWTKLYLTPSGSLATEEKPFEESKVDYNGFGEGITFLSEPLNAETEITGPMASKLFVSSETQDADLFLVVRVFTEDFKEVTFKGALDPNTPVGQGWLRASHRKLDPEMSKPYRPYYAHDEIQPLEPRKIYELDIEIWPTSIVIPKNYRIGLTVRGKDYVNQSVGGSTLPNMNKFSGCGPFLHNDPDDRPMDVFGKKVSLHFSEEQMPYLLLPVI